MRNLNERPSIAIGEEHEAEESRQNLFDKDERLHALADSIVNIVWSTDADGFLDFANTRWTEYTHQPPSLEDGAAWLALIHPDDRARTSSVYAHAIETGESFECEYRLRRWDGAYRWHLSRGVAHSDADGAIIRWIGTATDIDDLKQAHAALRESECRFRDIAENIREVFWLTDSNQNVIYVSPAYEGIWGHSCESCYANEPSFIDGVHPDDRGRLISKLETKFDGFDIEYRVIRPDGSIRWIHDRAFPVRDEDGNVVRVAGIAEDITERRALQEDIHTQAHLLAAVRQAIVSIDLKGTIVSWNRHAEVLYGWTVEEAVGKDLAALIFPEGKLDKAGRDSLAILESGQRIDREWQIRRKDGLLLWVSVSAAPIVDLNGKVTHILESSVDITERLRLEEQFRQSQKMEAVGRLAGGVAHDFNNLLTVIKGHVEFLSQAIPPDGQAREDLDQIAKSAQRAVALTRQLLAFSRQQVMEKHVIDANALLHELEKMLSRLIGEDIALTVSLQPNIPFILADAGQIEQAVINLVVNARDAMPNGGRLRLSTQSVVVTAAEAERHTEARPGNYVAIVVADNGTGIESDLLVKIFEPFFTTKDARRGTGLGLATTYGIARQTEGYVDVVSTPGKGSTFTIYLPAVPEDALGSVPGSSAFSVRSHELILLVEDQDEVRAVAKRILMTHGYRVMEARNGVDALAVLDAMVSGIDLVLTDAVMPQMGGPDLVRAMREKRPELPVVMASGYTDQQLVTYGAAELGVPFLHKPFRSQDLLTVVRNALDGSVSSATAFQGQAALSVEI